MLRSGRPATRAACSRKVGFQRQVDELLAYFKRARTRCGFSVVSLVDIRSFAGEPRWFHDGAHVARENAARIIARRREGATELRVGAAAA